MAGDLLSEFNDDAVVDDAVDGSGRGHGVFEDLVPLRKDQVGSDDDAAAFVAFGQQGEEHFHFVAGLLDVADVVEDEHFEAIEAAEFVFEQQVAFGAQQVIHQAVGGGEEDTASAPEPVGVQRPQRNGFFHARANQRRVNFRLDPQIRRCRVGPVGGAGAEVGVPGRNWPGFSRQAGGMIFAGVRCGVGGDLPVPVQAIQPGSSRWTRLFLARLLLE